jgi:nicotinamide-nucleotide amidase
MVTAPRKAAFLAIGSELLRTERLDTNSLFVSRELARCGWAMVEKRCLEDDERGIAAAVRDLLGGVELIVTSGGLGPTADDVTREAVAAALGRGLTRDATLEAWLSRLYTGRGRQMPAIAGRMADVIDGAEVLRNTLGAAPGQLLTQAGCTVVLLPGVPRELEEVLTTHVLPRLAGGGTTATRSLHLAGVYESEVEQRVSHLYERFGRDRVTILAGRGKVTLVLTAAGARAEEEVAEMEAAFAAAAGTDLFGRGRDTLPEVVLDTLRRAGWRLALAESCTGGLVGSLLTAVPGASEVLVGGVVAYANCVKSQLLGVPARLIERCGAVSEEVARAMAAGARSLGAECSLAITGVAGPTGGSADKPVGTVHIAAATPRGSWHRHHRFGGGRDAVRELAATFALDLLRRVCLEG